MENIRILSYSRNYGGLLILLSILSGCAWLDKSEHEKIIGSYEVGWNDLERNRCISKSIPNCDGCFEVIIDNYVYAVGHNEDFIIAKQHSAADTLSVNYFVIDIKANEKINKTGVYGPLSLKDFDSLVVKFKISGLRFDLNYPTN